MKDRPYLNWLVAVVAALIAALGARYGIPVPPIPPPSTITIPPISIVPPVPPPIIIPPPPAANAPAAIGRIQFGSAGCTTTIIGPRREDGKWNCLTAAHCVNRVGQQGTLRLKDGRVTAATVTAINTTADCAWLVTETNSEIYPFALIAHASPKVGERIWHAGYGVDRPGNREEGTVEALPDQNGQIRFRLSVSSGDSGGGICMNTQNEVVSCICCTTGPGTLAQVWGASVESIHKSQPTVMILDGWEPVQIPVRMPPKP